MPLITPEVSASLKECVLGWLATVSPDGIPNVSPKEAFLEVEGGGLIIANIASPHSVQNIRTNPNVCFSFINIFIQKGYKVIGKAEILDQKDHRSGFYFSLLQQIAGAHHKVISVISIKPEKIEGIVAPSYRIFEKPTELDMIKQSAASYEIAKYLRLAGQSENPDEAPTPA